MAIAHAIGARDKGATCRICGQPALPVVRLCAQCKAALKRVRHDTVSQHMSIARRPRRGERSRAAVDDRIESTPRRGAGSRPGVRAPLAVAALLGIIGSAGYFIVQQIHAALPPETSVVVRADTNQAAIERSPVVVSTPVPPAPIPVPVAADTTNDVVATPVKPKVATRILKPAPAPIVWPTPEVRPEPAPAPVVVAAAPPPAARPPDRMQLLSQAFAQCPNDGVLARMVCEQKARVQYCDGYWGQSPLCPNGMPDRNLSH